MTQMTTRLIWLKMIRDHKMMIPYPLAYMVVLVMCAIEWKAVHCMVIMASMFAYQPAHMLVLTPHVVEWKAVHYMGDHSQHVCIQTTEGHHPPDATAAAAADAAAAAVVIHTIAPPVVEFYNGNLVPHDLIPSSISKSTQKTLDQYENNYRLFSQRLKNDNNELFVRVITLKNNLMFLNFTCKILGTTNVIEAILASTYIMCSKLLEHLTKGDTFLCSLEAGYLTIRNSIIRNKHVFNLVDILNQIKVKTGLYTIMEGSKYDWLEYASNDTIHL